jgi:hypothetical protein
MWIWIRAESVEYTARKGQMYSAHISISQIILLPCRLATKRVLITCAPIREQRWYTELSWKPYGDRFSRTSRVVSARRSASQDCTPGSRLQDCRKCHALADYWRCFLQRITHTSPERKHWLFRLLIRRTQRGVSFHRYRYQQRCAPQSNQSTIRHLIRTEMTKQPQQHRAKIYRPLLSEQQLTARYIDRISYMSVDFIPRVMLLYLLTI